MKKIFGICFYNVGNPVCGIKAKCKGLLIQALFLYVKNFFLKSIIFKVERNVLITKKDGSEAEVQVIR